MWADVCEPTHAAFKSAFAWVRKKVGESIDCGVNRNQVAPLLEVWRHFSVGRMATVVVEEICSCSCFRRW